MLRKTILDLPGELKHQVAGYLEVDDALSLALTCRSFQDAGESVIWEHVNLSSHLNNEYLDRERSDDDDLLETIELERTRILDLTKHVVRGIENRPARGSAIRGLWLSLVPEVGGLIWKLLQASALTLHTLFIIGFHETPFTLFPTDDSEDHINTVFDESVQLSVFPRLVYLALHSTVEWQTDLIRLLALTPRLLHLLIFEAEDNGLVERLASEEAEWPPLTNLNMLEFECSSSFIIPMVRMIRKYQDVSIIVITGTDMRLDEESDEPLIKALREHKGVDNFTWCVDDYASPSGLERLFNGTGWNNLRTLEMGAAVETESQTYLESFLIPPAPALEEIIIPCRKPGWHPQVETPYWAKSPPPFQSIASSTIDQLKRAPSLKIVYFSHGSDVVKDPHEWCQNKVNGVLIRSYTNGKDEFFHLRRLELLEIDVQVYDRNSDRTPKCNGYDHRWVNHTFFNGRIIPDQGVLEQMYRIQGESWEWVEPGRGLSLDDDAWDYLNSGITRPNWERGSSEWRPSH